MKAKMPQGYRVAEAGDYLCLRCEKRFTFVAGELICPVCSQRDANDLVPVYLEDDIEADQLYSDCDFGQGD